MAVLVTGALPKHGISWDGDIPMITDGSNHLALGVSLGADDEFKFRQDAGWAVNLGGDFGGLDNDFAVTQDGPNIKVGVEGVYDLFVNPGAGTAKVVEASGAKASSSPITQASILRSTAVSTERYIRALVLSLQV